MKKQPPVMELSEGMKLRIDSLKNTLTAARLNGLNDEHKLQIKESCHFLSDASSRLSIEEQQLAFKSSIYAALSKDEVKQMEDIMMEIVVDGNSDLTQIEKADIKNKVLTIEHLIDLDERYGLPPVQRKQLVEIFTSMDDRMRSHLTKTLSPATRQRVAGVLALDRKEHPKIQEDARAFTSIQEWMKDRDFSIIQKNEAPRAHRAAEAMLKNEFYPLSHPFKEEQRKMLVDLFTKVPSIVVRHNWMQAIGEDLRETANEVISISLPFPTVLFEFMVHGKCIIVAASEQEDGSTHMFMYIEFEKNKWLACAHDDDMLADIYNPLRRQVEAICVALSVEIAGTEEIQQPEALNRKRLKNNKLPLRSYHVVDLSKRFQDKKMRKSGVKTDSDGPKVRLHWRRKHWRHFKNGHPSIVIEWMLVGNIDLGFIEKHYLM